MEHSFKNLNTLYSKLVPSKEEGLVVLWLTRQIHAKEIDKHFTHQNIKNAIQEVANLEPGGQPQTERILKNLLHYFIERPPNSSSRYKLTEYAAKFTQLIENKLENPYQKFPLRESFKRYTDFRAENIEHVDQLIEWFHQGFNNTTRQTIIEHLEALKDDVTSSVQKLNLILHEKEESALTTALKFTEIFKTFGEKADEIRDTLKLGNELEQQIQKVVNFFDKKVEKYKHPQTKEEQKEFNALQDQVQKSVEIQKEISSFFLMVDEKLSQLREKILFASTKLNDLQQYFQYQSSFKINIKRFLQLVLKESSYHPDRPIVPSQLLRKGMCNESFKFTSVPYYEGFAFSKNEIIRVVVNSEYEKREKGKIELELKRQERVTNWFTKYKEILKLQKYGDFTEYFYEILNEENDVEIALQVGHELLQFIAHSDAYKITINRLLTEETIKREVVIWKMIIHPSA